MENPFIGEIGIVAFNFAPQHWAFCSGQLLSISQNPSLYSLLGTAFGGDGRSSFGIPDLRGRIPVGASEMGNAPAVQINLARGQSYGSDIITLNSSQLPTHNHNTTLTLSGNRAVKASNSLGTEPTPGANGANTLASTAVGRDTGQNIYNSETPTVDLNTGSSDNGGTVTIANAGSSSPFSVMQPSLGLNYIIALQGIYPTRS